MFLIFFLSVIVFSILISCANPEISKSSENSKISKSDTDVSSINPENMQYAVSGPDLDITNMTITSSTDNSFNYDITIKNKSNVAVPDLYNVTLQNYYSANTVYGETGYVAAGGSIIGILIDEHRPLAAGESFTMSFAVCGSLPSGMNYITCKINHNNKVEETNENNNTYALPVD